MSKCVIIRVNTYRNINASLDFFKNIFSINHFIKSTNIALNVNGTSFHFVTDDRSIDYYRGLIIDLIIYDPWFVTGRNNDLDIYLTERMMFHRPNY